MEPTIYGRIEGGNVGSALRALASAFSDQSVCIVRSIDSIHDSADLTFALVSRGIKSSTRDGNVCVGLSQLVVAANAGLFAGFDEVWVFTDHLPTYSLMHLPGATSDTTDFETEVPSELREGFEKTGCALLLADGNGLNFATPIRPIAKRLNDARDHNGSV